MCRRLAKGKRRGFDTVGGEMEKRSSGSKPVSASERNRQSFSDHTMRSLGEPNVCAYLPGLDSTYLILRSKWPKDCFYFSMWREREVSLCQVPSSNFPAKTAFTDCHCTVSPCTAQLVCGENVRFCFAKFRPVTSQPRLYSLPLHLFRYVQLSACSNYLGKSCTATTFNFLHNFQMALSVSVDETAGP